MTAAENTRAVAADGPVVARAPRVLVVDDTEGTRYFVARALQRHGLDVVEAATGEQALELARRERTDVVVLDVKLPDIHGFDVASRLRADPATRSIAILHLSASFTAPASRVEGLKQADGYLTHPVDPDVLCATVDALLRVREAEQREHEARRLAEANEARYRFLAEAVPDMVWSTDGEGRLDYANRRWLDATGLTLEEARDWGWAGSIHPADREHLEAVWREALATGAPYEIEARQGDARAGAFRWHLIRALPMRDAGGCITRWFGTCTDIEERRLAQHEREALIARLRDEDRRKTDFLSQLSHELRNPLAPIRTAVHILRRAVPGSEQATRAVDMIERQSAQMTRLVDDLLDVSRVSRGKIRLHRERVDLAALVRNLADDVRELFASRGVALTVHTPPAPVAVWGDAGRLTQVIGNLLQNAAKFTPAGGWAQLSLRTEAGSAVVRCEDSGCGIDPALLPRIFEPFVQGDASIDRARGGLGLGLALVRALADAHGGSVEAESQGLGLGATFRVRLPLAADDAPPPDETAG